MERKKTSVRLDEPLIEILKKRFHYMSEAEIVRFALQYLETQTR